MSDTTSKEENSSGGMVCPFTGKYLSAARVKELDELDELDEQVRLQLIPAYSSSRFYRAAAEKEPE